MNRIRPVLANAPLALVLGLGAAAAAQTADDVTPAVEDICTKWGFSGQVNGLCKAYCEAMDCDDPSPQASAQACTRVLDKITAALGDTPFPTCQDADDDGEPAVVTCPCLGVGEHPAPATTEERIASAEAFAAQYGSSSSDTGCSDGSPP